MLVDGTEIGQGGYAATLIVHLLAPLVVLAGVAVIGHDLRSARTG